jgi:hypothetical protein
METYMVWPLQCAEWMEGLWPNRFLHMFVTVEYTVMVEPLFSITSTGAEVWLVLCELSLSHPVCSHKMEVGVNLDGLTTSMCRVDERSVTYTIVCIFLFAVDVNPYGWTTNFDHIYKSWGVVGFMWDVSFTSQRGCVLYDAHLCWKWMLGFFGLTTSNCRVVWKVCDLNRFLHMFVAVDVHPDGWTTVVHHIYKSWGVNGFVVSWVLLILEWMCMSTCVGSGC